VAGFPGVRGHRGAQGKGNGGGMREKSTVDLVDV
jgi:hypothetical protein